MTKRLLIGLIAAVLIFGFGLFLTNNRSNQIEPSPKPQIQEQIKVNLSVDGGEPIDLELNSGDDACSVLKKALEEKKITDLDMRYEDKYKTNGVYVINGLGKKDSIWWVYKINGVDAAAGCSQVKVHSGDKIEWNYLGEK